jgi:hypothetical protein
MQRRGGRQSVYNLGISASYGGTVSFLFWNSCFLWAKCQFLILKYAFLMEELSIYFGIRVSCGRTVSFLFWNLRSLWTNCQFILKFVFLVAELSLSYF